VLVSAALKPEGLQRTALVLAVTKPARFYVSPPILEEYAAVLSRAELDIRKGVRQQLLRLIRNHSYLVSPARRLEVAGDHRRQYVPRMRRWVGRRLSDYRQSAAFPKILEENQVHNDTGVYQPGCASFNKVAKFTAIWNQLMPLWRVIRYSRGSRKRRGGGRFTDPLIAIENVFSAGWPSRPSAVNRTV